MVSFIYSGITWRFIQTCQLHNHVNINLVNQWISLWESSRKQQIMPISSTEITAAVTKFKVKVLATSIRKYWELVFLFLNKTTKFKFLWCESLLCPWRYLNINNSQWTSWWSKLTVSPTLHSFMKWQKNSRSRNSKLFPQIF